MNDLSKSDPNFSCILKPQKRKRLRSKKMTITVQPMKAVGFSVDRDGIERPNGIEFSLPPKITIA